MEKERGKTRGGSKREKRRGNEEVEQGLDRAGAALFSLSLSFASSNFVLPFSPLLARDLARKNSPSKEKLRGRSSCGEGRGEGEKEIEAEREREKQSKGRPLVSLSPLLVVVFFFCRRERERAKKTALHPNQVHALARKTASSIPCKVPGSECSSSVRKGGKSKTSGGERRQWSFFNRDRPGTEGKEKKKARAEGDDHHHRAREPALARSRSLRCGAWAYLTSMRSLHGWPWRL